MEFGIILNVRWSLHAVLQCSLIWAFSCVTFKTAERRHSTKLTAIIEEEGNGFVALCPELDIASQGDTVEQARDNLREALELFFETASPEEIKHRFHGNLFITQVEIAVG